jgi:AraC-like DNA-binding protein
MNDRVLVAKMIAHIEQNLLEPVTVADLAMRSGYSLNRFRQKFYAVTGETPSGYLRKRRLTEASRQILSGDRIVDVALRWGYSSQENFTTAFRSYFGVTPNELSRIEGKYRRFIRRLREAYTIMELAELKQPPVATTLMGCMKGAADFFDLDLSMPMLFGLTGHAFLLNMHDTLCPSGPYVWNSERFDALLATQGIVAEERYTITRESDADERELLDRKLREHLDEGRLCILNFLENQLVSGYDERGFVLLQPWGCEAESEISRITSGTWEECLEREGWAHVTVLRKGSGGARVLETAKQALAYGVALHRDGSEWEVPGYHIGTQGYEKWLELVKAGRGTTHGHWWNATVWSECRTFGARFFDELRDLVDDTQAQSVCVDLTDSFAAIGRALDEAKDRELDPDRQVALISAAYESERDAIPGMEELAALLP